MPGQPPIVVCFGEILWDFLPAGIFPGGAPCNVAYHLQRQGLHAHVASAVGRDLLGDELLRRLKLWGLATDGIARHQGLPTGYVRAVIGETGDARYEITPSVAWDQIATGEDTIRATHLARALVFGSLAQRSTFNRAALERLLAVLPADALRVFDVNLRAPHEDPALVLELASRATLLKLNDAEAARLCGDERGFGREEGHARALAGRTGCRLVCLTAGAHGAGLLHDDRWHWEPGRSVPVVDTVGAGDAFLATLLGQLLRGAAAADSLARACRVGEWVATRPGATPAYDASTPTAAN